MPMLDPYDSYQHASAYEGTHSVHDADDMLFGHFCFTCGNATQGSLYCSRGCRASDDVASPEDSPALPPLVSSARSTCSSPPSSNSNSPSPLSAMMADLGVSGEPPRLDLPALAHKLDFGGGSLPLAARFPPAAMSHALSYSKGLPYSGKELKSSSVGAAPNDPFEDLKYRRKSGGQPSQTVPAPLYFRQAAAHHSPAILPSSPPTAALSPRVQLNRPPSLSNVSAFSLPPLADMGSTPVDTAAPTRSSSANTSARRPAMDSPDLLLSPRIRALRTEEGAAPIAAAEVEKAVASDDADNHSAFARYLFSQLEGQGHPSTEELANASTVSLVPREQSPISAVPKRSISADSVLPPPPSTRPSRFFFARGNPASDADEEGAQPTPPKKSAVWHVRPGHYIHATVGSALSSETPSPIPSSPPSPPAVYRGRSATRRSSASVDSTDHPGDTPSPDPRGRSKLRGLGAVKRSLSPVRDPSKSASRGREAAPSFERGRLPSRSSTRSDRSETRGRPSHAWTRDGEDSVVLEESEDDDEEERGRRSRPERGRDAHSHHLSS